MAIIEVNFISKCLMRVVTFNAIIPVDKFGPQAENAEQKPLKTLYLLHGIFGNYTDWVNGTRIQAWAEANDLAVIMPSGENRFYLDDRKERRAVRRVHRQGACKVHKKAVSAFR